MFGLCHKEPRLGRSALRSLLPPGLVVEEANDGQHNEQHTAANAASYDVGCSQRI